MTHHLLGIAAALFGAAAPGAEPAIRCTVRDAKSDPATARPFGTPAARADVGGGFAASATRGGVAGGRRIDVTVTDTTGTQREIVIGFRLALGTSYTHLFVTDGRGPRPLSDAGSAAYRRPLALPAVTFYGPDGGVTVAAPFEVPAPTLTFTWQKSDKGLEVAAEVSNLRLPAGGEAKGGVLVGFHDSGWRPGLGWLVTAYPKYFHPPNPKVYDFDGPMIYDFVTPEDRLRRDLEQGLAWQELGWYWPHLGLYRPEADTWRRQPGSEGGRGAGGVVTTKMLGDYIATANRLGVGQFLYFQSTESWAAFAEKRFPASRVRRASGKLCPTWVKCVVMNPDPDGPFGAHILEQLRRLVATVPGMAGVFWDQNAYTFFDYAHDDGISMVGGRRVSMMEFAQKRILERGSRFLHEHGKAIMTNGGWTVGLARYCDGHMSEGTAPTRRLQYLCMFKHMTLLCYDSNLQRGTQKLMLALETGAQPSVTLGNDACRALFEPYRPIFHMLRRKQWVFHPGAYDPPAGIRGNIFRTGDGNYLATAVADPTRALSPSEQEQPVPIRLRVPDSRQVRHVFTWRSDLRGYRTAAAHRSADGFEMALRRPDPCGAVVLARRGRWLAASVPRLIAGRKVPVDLVVANLQDATWEGSWHVAVPGTEREHTLRIAPFDMERIPLGTIAVPKDAEKLTVSVRGPGPDGKATETVVDIPVETAVAVRMPSEAIVQVLKGKEVAYAVTNRLDEPITVDVTISWRQGTAPQAAKLSLEPREVRPMTAGTDLPKGGLWTLEINARWPDGLVRREMSVDVLDPSLPKDFRIDDVEGLTLQMDVFNSLGDRWADKPVTVNGIDVGRLPITGQTLRWHEGLEIPVAGEPVRRLLQKGARKGGDIELRLLVRNAVRNCFKIRNVRATLRTPSGRTIVSTWSRSVDCSAAGWLYSEGRCVRNGQPVAPTALRFLRKP